MSSFMDLLKDFLEGMGIIPKLILMGPRYGDKWKNCIRLGARGERFYRAWDIALEGVSSWQQLDYSVRETDPQEPRLTAGENEPESFEELPAQDDTKIRLVVKEGGKDGPEEIPSEGSGFTALSRQWSKNDPQQWYLLATYETSRPARVIRCINVFEDENQKPQVRINCNTYIAFLTTSDEDSKSSSLRFSQTQKFILGLSLLDSMYQAVRTRENWKQMFLLQVHHASLKFFAEFLEGLAFEENPNKGTLVGPADSRVDPTSEELRLWNLRSITKHSYECRHLREMGRKLTNTTEALVDVVRATPSVAESQPKTTKFMAIDMELRGCFKEINNQLQKLSEGLEHDLKFLELSRNLNQTRSVQQLTFLATLFLPLSLAAGVLSMQTRFKDLGALLYDFFGVVVLLGAIVAIVMMGMAVLASVKERESEHFLRIEIYRDHLRRWVLFGIQSSLLTFGCLLLSSFVVGMFRDVVLGAQILGYGIVAACGVWLLCGVFLFVGWAILRLSVYLS